MRAKRWGSLWLIGLMAACLGLGLFLLGRSAEPPGPRAPRRTASGATVPAGGRESGEVVRAAGVLRPTAEVEVGSEIRGTVVEVLVRESDRVKKGQPILRLDPSGFEAMLAKERAHLAAAEAEVRRTRGEVRAARAMLARFEEIAERSGGKVPSARELAKAEGELGQAEAAEAAARAAVSEARATVRLAEARLDKATIRSPVNGVVLARRVQSGQQISESATSAAFRVGEDLTTLELAAAVDQSQVTALKAGQRATITVDAWPARRYDGVVTRVGLAPHPEGETVTYPVAIHLKNEDLALRPGMTATTEITTTPFNPPRS